MKQEMPSQAPAELFNQDELTELRALIDTRLEYFFSDCAASSRLGCAVRHGLLSPGKRFRPIITLLAYIQSGGSQPVMGSPSLDAACAVEMIHAASLIMDDLPSMDDAKLRRGALTTHMVFGEGSAMLAAIALLNEAYKVISTIDGVEAAAKLNAINHLTKAIGVDGLAGGQDRDIACNISENPCSDSALKEMEKRHLEKTGALFAAAAAIGGELGGASPEAIKDLSEYGCNLGLAYQAFDDVVDVTCTAHASGKDTEQDQDKSTVVTLLGTDGARIQAERHLRRAIDNAQSACTINPSPLAKLARTVGNSFGSMTK